MILAYIKYFLACKDEHSLHSPFLYELYTQVIKPDQPENIFIAFEKLRNKLKHSAESIQVTDYGAKKGTYYRKVSSIASKALARQKYSRLLYRLIRYFEPNTIIELGTSLGVNSLYMGSAVAHTQFITFEGCPNIAKIALDNFQATNLKNTEIITGNIDDTLMPIINNISKIDFLHFDANHKYEPTIRYFELCLSKAHENSVFVFDDIHWSVEMENAWQVIKAHEAVTISVDLFQYGLVFFRKKQPKQHFVLKY